MDRQSQENFDHHGRSNAFIEVAGILIMIEWLLGLAAGYALPAFVHAVALTVGILLLVRWSRTLGK